MKFKITPLLLVSIGSCFYVLYVAFFTEPDPQGWKTLEIMASLGMAILAFIIYLVLRAIFRNKMWIQFIIEFFGIAVLLFYSYKLDGEFLFQLPGDYKGHVLIVYNVEGADKLKKNFFSNKIRLTVPRSGIVLTSSAHLNKKYYHGGSFGEDGKKINSLRGTSRRHGLPLDGDTIFCGSKNYLFDMWIIKDKPNWSLKDDTLFRLNDKFKLACELIRQKSTVKKQFPSTPSPAFNKANNINRSSHK